MIQLHATCVSHEGRGVIIRGPSGSGKSDLALRLLARGFSLVADDRVCVANGIASRIPSSEGQIEVRGLGIYMPPSTNDVRIWLVVLDGRAGRIAEPAVCEWTGAPLVLLPLLQPSTVEVIRLALDCLSGAILEVAGPLGGMRVSDAPFGH